MLAFSVKGSTVVSLEVKKVSSIAANDLSWASLLHNPPPFNNLPNDGLSSISDSFAPSTDKDVREVKEPENRIWPDPRNSLPNQASHKTRQIQ